MLKTYGISLYSLAEEEGVTETILSEMRSISELFNAHPDYVKILDSPQIAGGELMEILNEDFFERVSRYTLNFLKILCEKHMVHCLDECLKEYERLYNEDNGIRLFEATTARPMKKGLVKKLIAALEEKTGGKIVLKSKVDNECIGGIIIEAEGIKLDSSVKSELNKIKTALRE